MDLDELVALIRAAWPDRLERGRVTHVHRNFLKLADGSTVHLRVLVQTVEPSTEPLLPKVQVIEP